MNTGGVIARRLHIRSYEVFSEWTAENVESIVFNAPGLEEDTFATLKEIPHAYHIANAGNL